jgi:Toxin co-regulated pilus biosynthesis protein Q
MISRKPLVQLAFAICTLITALSAHAQSSKSLLGSPLPATSGSTDTQQWEVRADDQRLAKTFERWARQAGVIIKWDAPKHVLLGASTVYTGSLEKAIFDTLASPGVFFGEERLEACIYPNTPPLIRITKFGEQLRECPLVE